MSRRRLHSAKRGLAPASWAAKVGQPMYEWLKSLVRRRFALAGACYRALPRSGAIAIGPGLRIDALPRLRARHGARILLGRNLSLASGGDMNFAGVAQRCSLVADGPGVQLIVGDHCGFSGVSLFAGAGITIGNHVLLGVGARIYDTDFHALDPVLRRHGREGEGVAQKPVVIEDDVWVGAMAVILKGVTLGQGCVIGAGAVVTKDVPAGMLVGGNPARVIRPVMATQRDALVR